MMKALLQDNTRCIRCRGCQVACKAWNDLPGEDTTFFAGPGYQNPRDLSASTWTIVTYNSLERDGRFDWVFGRRMCMHCQEPACASACPVEALKKTEDGPVVYDGDKCIGCRYCMLACPFLVPQFEWSKALPRITKCTMCADRIAVGEAPACAKVCPTGAITFGERDELIAEAHRRIRSAPSEYIHHIYGEEEVGGTSVLHLSGAPFDMLGYPKDLPTEALSERTNLAMKAVPSVVMGLTVITGAIYGLLRRRMAVQDEPEDNKEQEETHAADQHADNQ